MLYVCQYYVITLMDGADSFNVRFIGVKMHIVSI